MTWRQLEAGVQAGIDELGEIDIVIANAGVVAIGDPETRSEPVFNTIVDTNLKGVWHTMLATVPSIIRKGRGGSVVLVSSSQGLTGRGGDGSAAMFAYAASKHGVVGLMRSAANAYAPHKIRVNSVHPSGVATPMILNDFVVNRMMENPNPAVSQMLLPDVPLVEPQDVTEAVLWLVSPRARYVTGVADTRRRRPRRHVAASQPTSTAYRGLITSSMIASRWSNGMNADFIALTVNRSRSLQP